MTTRLSKYFSLCLAAAWMIDPARAQSCLCWTDQDCRRSSTCPNTCRFDWVTRKRRCVNIAPPPPTPSPTDAPVDIGDQQVIPSVCQVNDLMDLMDRAVRVNTAIAPQWLRLAFHDAGTFNQVSSEGGANGCLMTEDAMRQQPENMNLDLAIETLRTIQTEMINNRASIRLSSADLIQFAGFFVAVRQRNVPGMDQQKADELTNSFRWGRVDETDCDIAWTLNLPDFQLGADGNDMPERCLFAGTEIREKMMERNGFTAREASALIGAHTIGQTRNIFGPSLAGAWVRNGADDATLQGPVFDNEFHRFLVNTINARSVAAFSRTRFPFNQDFPNWFRSGPIDVNHLDTDVVLAFPSLDTAVHPSFNGFSQEFANSNAEFIETFMNALTKMSQLGVDVPLFVPNDTCVQFGPPPPPAPIAPGVPRPPVTAPTPAFEDLLTGSIDTAEDLLDQTLVEREDEITFLTTPVNVGV